MFGVGMIPWSPLARGVLTRPVSSQSTLRSETDPYVEQTRIAKQANALMGRWAKLLDKTRGANDEIVKR